MPVFIMMTGFADFTESDLIDKGAYMLLAKPFKPDELIQSIRRALDKK